MYMNGNEYQKDLDNLKVIALDNLGLIQYEPK